MAERDVIATLNNLIETCRDGEQGFKHAAEHVKDGRVKSLFTEMASERARLADELRHQVQQLGGRPEEGGSAVGAMHRGWMNVKDAATRDDAAIVAEAERGEDAAVSSYREALEEPLPPAIQGVVERQYASVKGAHDRVRALEQELESRRAL